VQALRECWGYRVIDQNVNPENISFLLMWSDASLEDSKVQASKDALYLLGKPADVKAEVEKLHWEYYQAFQPTIAAVTSDQNAKR